MSGQDAAREALLSQLADTDRQLASLRAAHAGIVAASESSNADDEHDPEGATIAFERQQVLALLDQAHRTREELAAAVARLDSGRYGECEACGSVIAPERLEARPGARTCIACARRERGPAR